MLNTRLKVKSRALTPLTARFFQRQTSRLSRPDLDFRSFTDCLREDGDLADVHIEVDPHLEVGAIARRVSELNAKAPMFHNVKGSQKGLWRIFSNAAGLRKSSSDKLGRVARGLGLPPNSSWKDINRKILAAKKSPVFQPNVLPTGPCKENRISGDDIDLPSLPCPSCMRPTVAGICRRMACTSCSRPMGIGRTGQFHGRWCTTRTIL